MIELRTVTKTYRNAAEGYTALKRVDLTIASGEYAAIVGKSGSGKSTLLNMLTGIDHPSSGKVVINGDDVHAFGESQLASWRGRSIGIVFQFFQLIPTLTILENVLLAMDFVNVIQKNKRRQRAGMLLEQVGIGPHVNRLPAALSGGEQQRAAIARAMANDPPILVADEPTGNLDSHTTGLILKLFREMVDAGKTVIVVTHEKSMSAGFERIITLKDGAVEGDHKTDMQSHGALA